MLYLSPELCCVFEFDRATIAYEVAIPLEKLYPFLRVQGQILELVLKTEEKNNRKRNIFNYL